MMTLFLLTGIAFPFFVWTAIANHLESKKDKGEVNYHFNSPRMSPEDRAAIQFVCAALCAPGFFYGVMPLVMGLLRGWV
jgi:hypothetical protein